MSNRDRLERLEAALAQRERELALLNRAARALSATLDLDRVLATVLEEARRTLDVAACSVWLLEPETGELVCRQATGPQRQVVLGWRLQPGQGIAGWVARSGQSAMVPDTRADPRYFAGVERRAGVELRSVVSAPLRVDGRVTGVLYGVDERVDRFSGEDLLVLESLAGWAAIAVENARLYQRAQREIEERTRAERELRARNLELGLLNRVIVAAAASNPEAVLETACRELALAFDVPQASACLLNGARTHRTVVAGYLAEGQAPLMDAALAVESSPLVHYLLTRQAPLVVEDARHDPRLAAVHALLRERGVGSLLGLPLLVGGEVAGCLALIAVEPRRFSAGEISLAWSVADQVAGCLARARLASRQQRLAAAVDQTADGVMVTDVEGIIQYVNPAFERITGYRRAEAIGQPTRFLSSGRQDAAYYAQLWATIGAGEVWQGRLVDRKKDATLYTADASISPIRDESGKIVNYVAIQRDVTRELQLEAQYLQAQKLGAIGRLTAGIAHDFNNLLTAVNGFAELLLVHLPPGEPARDFAEKIYDAGRHAADLVAQLLAFSRQQALERQVLDLNAIVTGMGAMLRRIIGEDVELVTVLSSDLWPVLADRSQVEQIVANLAVNARDAMPDGGRLTLETRNVAGGAVPPDLAAGEYLLLSVRDTGVGMSDEVKAHLFEPFFTTKGLGKGTGLGLATVHGIVEQSGGQVRVDSQMGQGAVFRIYLPRFRAPVGPEAEPAREAADLPGGEETILLVEDDGRVRDLTRRMLEERGYRVLEAPDAGQALSMAAEYSGHIHLLLMDLVLPGMSSGMLAERLGRERPGLRVLFMSGYAGDDVLRRYGVGQPGVALLRKPFGAAGLLQQVRQVLDDSC